MNEQKVKQPKVGKGKQPKDGRSNPPQPTEKMSSAEGREPKRSIADVPQAIRALKRAVFRHAAGPHSVNSVVAAEEQRISQASGQIIVEQLGSDGRVARCWAVPDSNVLWVEHS